MRFLLFCLFTWLFNFSALVSAQETVRLGQDYADRVRAVSEITSLKGDIFGESVDIATGATRFNVTDIELGGNDLLEVSLRRSFLVRDRLHSSGISPGIFADWDLDIPHLYGVYPAGTSPKDIRWFSSMEGEPARRCSVDRTNYMKATPPVAQGTNGGPFSSAEYWYGNYLRANGSDEALMVLDPANPNRPSMGEYFWTTPSGWMFSCLAQTANGVPGEAFFAVSPEGHRFWFDWFVARYWSALKKPVAICTVPQEQCFSDLSRNEVLIYPTRVEDRFGNSVRYVYDPAIPKRLLTIIANDGRRIDLTYSLDGKVASASAAGRTWSYTYRDKGGLASVKLPDGSTWLIDAESAMYSSGYYSLHGDCSGWGNNYWASPQIIRFTHPSGATGEFSFQGRRHARTYVPRRCKNYYGSSYLVIPPSIDGYAIERKTITGNGVDMTWQYQYESLMPSFEDECSGGTCARSRAVTVTGPDGTWKKYRVSSQYGALEGRVLSVSTGRSQQAVSTQETTYLESASGQPFPSRLGRLPCHYCDRASESLIPIQSQTTVQDGVRFLYRVDAYDRFGRPAQVLKQSSPVQ